MESFKGKLLVAGASLFDPNFRRTVVLVGEHNEEGALGLVLNRQSPVAVEEAAPPLTPLVQGGSRLYFGGPVQRQAAVVLAQFEHPELAGLLVFDSIGFLMGDVPSDAAQGIRRARVFAGYAGWGPGQLEDEVGRPGVPHPRRPLHR